ncbi:hypothetical protein P9A54_gp19 [Xanthomonas phage vB_Xar_IVIA-DoCa10]|uniref:Uncharacterized protein n=1 Tax=Xanthomonas phage vB_Xar_IVIA-DoCa10 TaxID=2975529 RepID=A0A9X9JPQ7_9CAUD|nr:hypothetical protein P9A54_gp19 [Xanthomonas phage vB_Xar_IVIA-DoCa10]UYA99004.1 hypothetical protein IVIADoCa10_19 [Xanthomonas phage vB_Xar_IVIA-DoCa10]
MNKPTTEKAIAFLAKNPTYFGTVAGVDLYEHPTLGDESPIMAITADGRVKRTHCYCMSDARSEAPELRKL